MGWERKSGKLGQFNRFLRGKAADAFSTIVGDTTSLQRVRYVITLDSDTVLPRDAAQMLAGTMAHPLNKADYDPQLGRIVRGYGIFSRGWGFADERSCVTLCGDSLRASGSRSIHDSGIRRVSGSFR